MARGVNLIGLALALSELQHETEVWVHFTSDFSFSGSNRGGKGILCNRVLIKGVTDSIDDDVLGFWLGHPASLRRMLFTLLEYSCAMEGIPVPYGYGHVTEDHKVARLPGLPEGTIHTPGLHLLDDIDTPETYIMDSLRKLGLVD